jgi:hypothetical protein
MNRDRLRAVLIGLAMLVAAVAFAAGITVLTSSIADPEIGLHGVPELGELAPVPAQVTTTAPRRTTTPRPTTRRPPTRPASTRPPTPVQPPTTTAEDSSGSDDDGSRGRGRNRGRGGDDD